MDRKRVWGPETSVVPLTEKDTLWGASSLTAIDTDHRSDGRSAQAVRGIYVNTGAVLSANGSALFESGSLKVVCSVYGPRQAPQQSASRDRGTINCWFKFTPFSCRGKRKGYVQDAQEKEFSTILQQSLAPAVRLDLIPKSTIDVFVQVLENDGTMACLSAAVSCASLALADAGIEMIDQVVGHSVGVFGEKLLVDCSTDEELFQTGSVFLAYMPSLNEVTHVVHTGKTGVEQTMSAMDMCIDAASKISNVMQQALVDALPK
ncbi:ribosomal protein S5 domain 2-type protein [Cladochytrium replicatum]|nr:ribosomal protein S5 domain 2-type protein [Cladochytrium replicatum]